MIFSETRVRGAFVLDLERREDERGYFARAWCRKEFETLGLVTAFVQANVSFSKERGTVRGLHYQAAPHEETKLIRCSRGAIYDVVLDVRKTSLTYGEWVGIELVAGSQRTLYVPAGCAHGFQTLEDDTEVFYQVSEFYAPAAERGVRYDDPAFRIRWPRVVAAISEKDRSWPDYVR